MVSARARYSASVLERATKVCFLLRQEIKEEPRRSNNLYWNCDQWDLLPNQHQRMDRVQEETELSRECPSGIEECAEQQHSELIVEQTDIGSPDE